MCEEFKMSLSNTGIAALGKRRIFNAKGWARIYTFNNNWIILLMDSVV